MSCPPHTEIAVDLDGRKLFQAGERLPAVCLHCGARWKARLVRGVGRYEQLEGGRYRRRSNAELEHLRLNDSAHSVNEVAIQ